MAYVAFDKLVKDNVYGVSIFKNNATNTGYYTYCGHEKIDSFNIRAGANEQNVYWFSKDRTCKGRCFGIVPINKDSSYTGYQHFINETDIDADYGYPIFIEEEVFIKYGNVKNDEYDYDDKLKIKVEITDPPTPNGNEKHELPNEVMCNIGSFLNRNKSGGKRKSKNRKIKRKSKKTKKRKSKRKSKKSKCKSKKRKSKKNKYKSKKDNITI